MPLKPQLLTKLGCHLPTLIRCVHSSIITKYIDTLPKNKRRNSTSAKTSEEPSEYIYSESNLQEAGGLFRKIGYRVGFGEVNIFKLNWTSICHYEACTDKLKPEIWFETLGLKDTFFSFYLIVQLHVWMCQARSMSEGPEGRRLRNEIMRKMWVDLETRLKNLEMSSVARKIGADLSHHHNCAMLSYDEGLLTDDKTLAGALWRTLFCKEQVDPQKLELTVKYVRHQMEHLRSIGPREWCLSGRFDWAPFPPLVVGKASSETQPSGQPQ